MKQKLYSLLIIGILTVTIISIFNKSSIINQSISESFYLFANNIFPSLFPMFVISSILVEIGLPEFLGNLFSKLTNKLFKINGEASFVFFMSMITGFPSSAKYIEDLMNKNIINNKEATKILLFTFFSNPLFIVNTVGNMFLNNTTIGYLILIAHILGNILVGLITRNYLIKTKEDKYLSLRNNSSKFNQKINHTNLFKSLLTSIKNAINNLIIIFGIITTFMIIIGILFPNPNNIFSIITSGILEMTTGLKYVAASTLNFNTKVYLSTFFISFGGLSIHTQIMNILEEKKVRYLPFLFARVLHGIISVIILQILIKLI